MPAEHHGLIKRRVLLLLCALVLGIGGLFGRMVHLQVLEADRLRRLAREQSVQTVPIEAARGQILDRQGRPLAVNVEAVSVYAVPRDISDPDGFADAVAPILAVDRQAVLKRLQPNLHFVWLARKVSPEVAERLKALRLEGQIGFLKEARRAYPKGELAGQVLGFVGIDNQGLSGLELAYDEALRGHPGEAVAKRDARGRILVDTQRLARPPADGHTLLLTVDEVIQHTAERALLKAMARTQARRGAVVAMDPRTGELLALAMAPRFDPATFDQAKPHAWALWPVADVYEPGSTFKPVVAAAALEAGAITLSTTFLCEGALKVEGNHTIRDAEGKRHGWQTIAQILKNSCNIGAAQVGMRLGRERLHAAIQRFGFGNPTRVDLPGEGRGLVPPPAAWRGAGLATVSFGQGVSVTPLQMLVAISALANDGVVLQPRLVRVVRDGQGRVIRAYGPRSLRQAVSPQGARQVLAMMVESVREGTGTAAQVEGYRIAGKTGTAQKPGPRGYEPGKFIASFIGIVPAEDPRLAILVLLDEPKGEYFGGVVAAPVFREVATQVLWYLKVPPTVAAPSAGAIASGPAPGAGTEGAPGGAPPAPESPADLATGRASPSPAGRMAPAGAAQRAGPAPSSAGPTRTPQPGRPTGR
ncbi:MAG: penicillin-binding protein 2 [Armatimonadetes bacterium]|nr:penicillin-binding protein 2 [Armatimonadota bacterium]